MITGINKSKTLTKNTSWDFRCKFDDRKCSLNQKWNNNKCWCECRNLKEHHVCKRDYIWSPATCNCENGKYLASIIDDSVITSDEIIEETKTIGTKTVPTKTVPSNFNQKR